jgi:hypothetical protein
MSAASRAFVGGSLVLLVLGVATGVAGSRRPTTRVDTGPVGERVVARATVVSAAGRGPAQLRAEVEEVDAARVVPNLPVLITLPGSTRPVARGRVERVALGPERRIIGVDDANSPADDLVRVVTVACVGLPTSLPVGARAEAVIELGRHVAAARVARTAVSVREGRTVVDRAGPARLWTRETPIDVVAADDTFAEIRGLAPGIEVLVQGQESGVSR